MVELEEAGYTNWLGQEAKVAVVYKGARRFGVQVKTGLGVIAHVTVLERHSDSTAVDLAWSRIRTRLLQLLNEQRGTKMPFRVTEDKSGGIIRVEALDEEGKVVDAISHGIESKVNSRAMTRFFLAHAKEDDELYGMSREDFVIEAMRQFDDESE